MLYFVSFLCPLIFETRKLTAHYRGNTRHGMCSYFIILCTQTHQMEIIDKQFHILKISLPLNWSHCNFAKPKALGSLKIWYNAESFLSAAPRGGSDDRCIRQYLIIICSTCCLFGSTLACEGFLALLLIIKTLILCTLECNWESPCHGKTNISSGSLQVLFCPLL